jgi:methylenetetrahydrofolate dehydrogenase (NADP+)/methenyltetrahydrofolate cyclohydrolase
VIGRSRVVGLPMSLMLMARDATVTVAHHLTRDLASLVPRADLVVSATGVAGLVTAEMVKPGAVVIDVGTIRTEHGLVGDVDPGVREVAGMLTPVPGGVGPMTIATLLACTLQAAEGRMAAPATAR